MNKKIIVHLFLAVLIILQMTNTIHAAYDANADSERLIREAYFSPEMQYDVLACVERPFNINIVTGKIQNIPTVQEIIDQTTDGSALQNTRKSKALQAALEATKIAFFVAGLEAAYDQPEYFLAASNYSSELSTTLSSKVSSIAGLQRPDLLMPPLHQDLINALNTKKDAIEIALNNLRTWSSWIPNIFTRNPNRIPTNYIDLRFNPVPNNRFNYANQVTLPNDLILQIIKNYDYKQKINPDETANILFKQCFIAQQNENRLYFWPCTPRNHIILSTNYIFDAIPDINTFCNGLSGQVTHQAQLISRIPHDQPGQLANEQIRLGQIQNRAHTTLLQIRKAIQTALYIANKNSNFYIGYILPPVFTQYLDTVVQQLIRYDAKLSKMCTDPQLGATADDLYRDIIWKRIAWIAAGLAIGTAVIKTIDYSYGSGTSQKFVEKGIENSIQSISSTASNVAQGASNIISGTAQGIGNVASDVASGTAQVAGDFGSALGQAGSNILKEAYKAVNNDESLLTIESLSSTNSSMDSNHYNPTS